MDIWIMRHGEAGFNAPSDSQRSLTAHGEKMAFEQGKILGKRLLNQQVSIDKVLVSPYLRAQQTWQQLEQGLQAVGFMQSFAKVVETWQGITPSGSPDNVCDYLAFLREEGAQKVLIISHLPLVFDLVQTLTQHQQHVHFYPAVLAEIEWQRQQGKLRWTHAPS